MSQLQPVFRIEAKGDLPDLHRQRMALLRRGFRRIGTAFRTEALRIATTSVVLWVALVLRLSEDHPGDFGHTKLVGEIDP